MKYMLLMNYAKIEGVPPIHTWSADEVRAHLAHMEAIHRELTERGEFVDGQGLTGPEAVKIVTSDGASAPVVTDGPFPESKEFLAGYWLVDVETEERAIEIAAKTSAAPGPAGRPVRQQIEVRRVMDAPVPADV